MRQINHIDAVAAMLGDYRDVIAFIQAGYLGRWGEWNTDGMRGGNVRRAAALQPRRSQRDHRHVLAAYAAEGIAQDVELRRPVFAKGRWSSAQCLGERRAPQRLLHEQHRRSDEQRRGTYWHLLGPPRQPANFGRLRNGGRARAWAQDWTENASFGGETCPMNGAAVTSAGGSCSSMIGAQLGEPATLHMNYLNGDWAPDAVYGPGTTAAVTPRSGAGSAIASR